MRLDPLDKSFDQPVAVRTATGHLEVVTTVAKAADVLLNKWPDEGIGRKHLAARKACLRALEGLAEARAARQAFEEAAQESGNLTRPKVITDYLPVAVAPKRKKNPSRPKPGGATGDGAGA